MNSWYHSYKKKNILFEKRVENSLNEFHNFQIEEIWPRIKKELVYTITKLGCIPEYGKYFTEDGIDIRVICDKLYTFDRYFIEKLLIYLKSEKNIKKALPTKERINELVVCINKLGYIPYFREYRFSDGVDMFTWYNIYIKGNKDIEEKLNSRIEVPNKKRKVNIYLIPNFKSKGGKFYTICSNEGEVLDISNVTSYEEALELDSTLTKRGGVILKKNEEINEVRFVKGKKKDENKRKR